MKKTSDEQGGESFENQEQSQVIQEYMSDIQLKQIQNSKLFQKFLQGENNDKKKQPIQNQQQLLKNVENKSPKQEDLSLVSQQQFPSKEKIRQEYYNEQDYANQLMINQQNIINKDIKQQQQYLQNKAQLKDSYESGADQMQSQYYSSPQRNQDNSTIIKPSPNQSQPYQKQDTDEEVELEGRSEIIQQDGTIQNNFQNPSFQYQPKSQMSQKNKLDNMINQFEADYFSKDKQQIPEPVLNYSPNYNTDDPRDMQDYINQLKKVLKVEMDKSQTLEQKCKDLIFQLDKAEKKNEEYKQRSFHQNHESKSSQLEMEDKISQLNEKIYELQKSEDTLQLENDKLKSKSQQEILLRTKIEEDLREQQFKIQEIQDQINEKQRQCDKKDEQIVSLQQQIEQQKISNEKMQERSNENKDLQNKEIEQKELNIRKIQELSDKNQQFLLENERLKQELNNCYRDIQDKETIAESIKNEMYNQKQINLEKNQKEINLQIAIEKYCLEVSQLRGLLHRAETELRNVKSHNDHLINQISDIAREKNIDFVPQAYIPPPQKSLNNFQQNEMMFRPEINPHPITPTISQTQQQFSYQPQNNNNAPSHQQNENYNERQNNLKSNEFDNNIRYDTPPRQGIVKPQDHEIFSKQNFFEKPNKIGYNPTNNQFSKSPGRRNAKNQSSSENVLNWSGQQQATLQQQQKELQTNPYQSNQQQYSNQQNQALYQNYQPQQQQQFDQIYNQPKQQIQQQPPQQQKQFSNSKQFDDNKPVRDQNTIKNIEDNLLMLNIQKEKLESELRKLEEAKIRTGANIRRKTEINNEVKDISSNISQLKIKLREMNVLHPY